MIKNKKKICVVVASRANYGRVKSVLTAINKHDETELQLVVTASALLPRYGNVSEIILQDGFTISAKVYVVIEGDNPTTMAKSTGLAIIELATIFENLEPDIVFTVADRYETLSTAVAANYMNIPLAHLQGGEITGSVDESVRHAITKLSHIHFPATKLSKKRVITMGENRNDVYNVGCPSIDLITTLDLTIDDIFINKYQKKGVGAKINFNEQYLLVLQHPVTTEFGNGAKQISETLEAIASLKMQTIWLWPNIDAGSDEIAKAIRSFREGTVTDFIHFYINFPVEDYYRLLNNSKCIIGNSSSGIREGSYLGVPCVNIGTRQNNREKSKNVIDVNYDKMEIINAIKLHLSNGKYPQDKLYGKGTTGEEIAEILSKISVNVQKSLTL
jgi:UDP-hydrolysing UDP-N-acetyl-D-glucosamine 2-epimerase